ncbi:unnamed protein product [Bursaphelenchus xylophilus]|uniref:Acetyl-coenzyme A synthetase n=2 Tax=Bursaphelenchus xylophilus TaxID=6326 RepID=A0A7I8WLR2_BURXY|nr:unnamed protein product [Bursaphelenchus xylophilus]CAG9105100.1 unnamed protein product [Bursaphelenchus xylophilus]
MDNINDVLPGYLKLYDRSVRGPDFWLGIARELHFEEFSGNGLEFNFDIRKGPIYTKFLAGSKTNLAYNCLERIIQSGRGQKIAYRWEGNEPSDQTHITYEELHRQVKAFAAALRARGVRKGDTVAIYLPMILELPVAMLACARIDAPHTVVFAGFSSESLAERMIQARTHVIITADAFGRGGAKVVPLKNMADVAVNMCRKRGLDVHTQVVVEHIHRVKTPGNQPAPKVDYHPIDLKYAQLLAQYEDADSPVEWVDAEDPLFILYTSGSTGTPKGIVHSTAGYMTYAYATTKFDFDAQQDDVYWCTADGGWITGHTYLVYGPLLNGLTSIFFEGIPTYPTAARTWQVVEKYKVTKLYTSPTLVRSLMGFPDNMVKDHDRRSLKIIGTVGEPINPQAWLWLYEFVGERRCAIIDTYWQTETGGHVITAIPGAVPTKPGSATLPFFGVQPVLLDNDGCIIEGPGEGNLCFPAAWPGISRTVLGDHERFEKTYFKPFPGYYFTGDGCRRDSDGYYWITGRVDDLMNVSGHLLSTAEIESAITAHPDVVECAVVAAEHPVKGHSPYAFVIMRKDRKLTESTVNELKAVVREKIGPIAVPDKIQLTPGLPKTRSGKVTRRILRKIAEGDANADLGDMSTLVDSTVIDDLWRGRKVPVRTG